MTLFEGWAIALNGVILTGDCCSEQDTWDATGCAPNIVLNCLTDTPDGLDLPGLRTEDVTFAQRDGIRHYNDWYSARILTLKGSLGPADPACEGCTSIREQVQELIQAWKRTCCDVELVIYPPCGDDSIIFGDPIPVLTSTRTNLMLNPSVETNLTGWDQFLNGPAAFSVTRESGGGWVGDYFGRLENIAGPGCATVRAGLVPRAQGLPVSPGLTYTLSGYVRSNVAYDAEAVLVWYDSSDVPITADDSTIIESCSIPLSSLPVSEGDVTALPGTSAWTRLSVISTAPEDASYAVAAFITEDRAWSVGNEFDLDGVLFEQSNELLDYFDGDTPNSDDPVVGGERIEHSWQGTAHASRSVQQTYIYQENADRTLSGPYGMVGRPRVASGKWAARKEQVWDFTLRFDGVDQRLYLLDECGTPGFQECVVVTRGSRLLERCYTSNESPEFAGTPTRCYSGAGRCYPNEVESSASVDPVEIVVRGTERIYPSITLNPGLTNPIVENTTTGEFITFNGTIVGDPVIIDTQEGTAFQGGVSMTHLLGGSIFMSMEPGSYFFRMMSTSDDDDGTADICWRNTVVMA